MLKNILEAKPVSGFQAAKKDVDSMNPTEDLLWGVCFIQGWGLKLVTVLYLCGGFLNYIYLVNTQ